MNHPSSSRDRGFFRVLSEDYDAFVEHQRVLARQDKALKEAKSTPKGQRRSQREDDVTAPNREYHDFGGAKRKAEKD